MARPHSTIPPSCNQGRTFLRSRPALLFVSAFGQTDKTPHNAAIAYRQPSYAIREQFLQHMYYSSTLRQDIHHTQKMRAYVLPSLLLMSTLTPILILARASSSKAADIFIQLQGHSALMKISVLQSFEASFGGGSCFRRAVRVARTLLLAEDQVRGIRGRRPWIPDTLLRFLDTTEVHHFATSQNFRLNAVCPFPVG